MECCSSTRSRELPRQAQALLLLPLERRAFHPAVGRGPARTVDVKFVCATNRDLVEEVQAGGSRAISTSAWRGT